MKSSLTILLKIVIYLLHKELQQMYYYTDVLFTNVLVLTNTKQKQLQRPQVFCFLTSTAITCKKRQNGLVCS